MVISRRVRVVVIILLLSFSILGTAGVNALSPLIGAAVAQSPAAQSHGYICRLGVETIYHTSEDVLIKVVAYYSEGGRYVPRPVHITITIEYAGTGVVARQTNLTIDDPDIHTVNLGKFEMATYTAKAKFIEAGTIKTDNFVVKHDPVPYTLFLNHGGMVDFRGKGSDENDTFTLKIILQRSIDDTEECFFSNITEYKYTPPKGVKVMTIYVIDRYGNVNGMNNGQPYVWVYAQDKYYNLARIVAVFLMLIATIFAIIRIWRRML